MDAPAAASRTTVRAACAAISDVCRRRLVLVPEVRMLCACIAFAISAVRTEARAICRRSGQAFPPGETKPALSRFARSPDQTNVEWPTIRPRSREPTLEQAFGNSLQLPVRSGAIQGHTLRLSRLASISFRARHTGRISFLEASGSWSSTCFEPGLDLLP